MCVNGFKRWEIFVAVAGSWLLPLLISSLLLALSTAFGKCWGFWQQHNSLTTEFVPLRKISNYANLRN